MAKNSKKRLSNNILEKTTETTETTMPDRKKIHTSMPKQDIPHNTHTSISSHQNRSDRETVAIHNPLESQNVNNPRALYFACVSGDPETVQDLIQKGTRTDTKIDNETCLQRIYLLYSKYSRNFYKNKIEPHLLHCYLKIMELLIHSEYQLNPDLVSGNTIAHAAATNNQIKIIELLIKKNVSMDTINKKGETPLHIAYKAQFYEISNLLIRAGVKLNVQNEKNMLLLNYAIDNKDIVTVGLLIEYGANINSSDDAGKTPLYHAYKKEAHAVTKLLIRAKADLSKKYGKTGKTLLHHVSLDNELKLMHFLIKHRANINSYDDAEKTPLYYAYRKKFHDMTKLLIEAKADLSKKNGKGGKTLLHYVALNNESKLMELLIEHGANINIQDNAGDTPLHLACLNGCIEIVTILIKNEAKLNIENDYEETPINISSRMGFKDITKLLIESHADLDKKSINNKTLLYDAILEKDLATVKLLIEYEANIDIQDNLEETPLYHAYQKKFHDVTQLLIKSKADLNKKSICGKTLLHYVALNNESKLMELLIEHGANIDIQDNAGDTPLHLACLNGDIQIVKILIQHSAKLNIENKYQELPFHISSRKGFKDITKLLIPSKADLSKKQRERGVKRHCDSPSVSSQSQDHKKRKITDFNIVSGMENTELGLSHPSTENIEKMKALISQKNFEIKDKDKHKNARTLLLDIATREKFDDLTEYFLHLEQAS